MNIYVLTTKNEERVSYLKQLLDGIEFEFVVSLGISDLEKLECEFSKESYKYRKKALMLGEFGAFSTHASAWQKIIESGKPGIIIEDSADFIKESSLLLSSEVKQQIINYGLVSFSEYNDKVQRPQDKPIKFGDLKLNKAFPIRCYGLMPEFASVLLKNIDKTGMIQPVDKWLSIYKMSGVSGYLSNIGIATRRSNLKSIANVKRGKTSLNPLHLIYRTINKIKYQY